MRIWEKISKVFRESVADAFRVRSAEDDVFLYRQRAIRVILAFCLGVVALNFLGTRLFSPALTYHDAISAGLALALILSLHLLSRMKTFFWLWLVWMSFFFGSVTGMGIADETGIQTGIILVTVIMPMIGVYFIGRLGAVGGWLFGITTYGILLHYSLSRPPPDIYLGGYSQVYDIFLMGALGLTLCVIMALSIHDVVMNALADARESLRRARVSDLERTRFFGAISHEVRNSINGLFGITSSLLVEDLNDAARQKVELVQASGNSLIRVLNDTLEITRLETGNLDISQQNFDLHILVNQIAARWKLAAEEKGLAFEVIEHVELPQWIRSDPARIGQVLDNLLSNAVKFTQFGQIELGIGCPALLEPDPHLCFSVTDTGCGIHPDRAERIFEPYRQESSTTFARYGGTGLGLYICRLLAGQMKGKIWLEKSDADQTQFKFQMPVTPGQPEESPQDKQFIEMSELRKLRVLAVDDRQPNLRYLNMVLSSWGIGLTTAASGAECLEILQSQTFDVLLLDLNMPQMSGLELLRHVRQQQAHHAHMVAVVISADAQGDVRESLQKLGVSIFVAKPITPEMIWSALSAVWRQLSDERLLSQNSSET